MFVIVSLSLSLSLSLCSQGAPSKLVSKSSGSFKTARVFPEDSSKSPRGHLQQCFFQERFCKIVCLPAYLFVGLSVTRHRLEYYWNLGAPLSPLPGCWWDWCAYRWKRFPDKG